jgi:hypothetical protein
MIKVDEQKMIGRENRPMKDKINKINKHPLMADINIPNDHGK